VIDFKLKAQALLSEFLLGLDKMVDVELDKIADMEHEKNGYIAMQKELGEYKKSYDLADMNRQEEHANKKGELELAIKGANDETHKYIQKNKELEAVIKDQSLYLQSIKDDKKLSEEKLRAVDQMKNQYELKLASLKLDQDKMMAREHALNDKDSKLKAKETALLTKEAQVSDKDADIEIRGLELEKRERLVEVNLRKLELAK
jgi:hypothetical protein